jgi:hypothetical protein
MLFDDSSYFHTANSGGGGVTPPTQFVGASPQIEFGTTNDDGYLQNHASIGTGLSDGAYFDGTNWIATKTSAVILTASTAYGGFNLCTNTGLVVGNAFSPTQRAYFPGPGNPWTFTDALSVSSLPVADASNGGILTASAQSFPPGAKTFTDILKVITSGATATQVFFGSATGQGTLEADTTSAHIGWGFDYNGSVYTARQTSAGLVSPRNGTTVFFANTGLTSGNTFSPTDRGRIGTAGWRIGSGGTDLTQVKVYTQTITPASVAANTTAEQTFTVTGLTTADTVEFNPGAAPTAGTGIVGWRVSAADTLAVTYINATAGALTPASGTARIVAIRS